MNILMFTNTFTPHVGGVARSVKTLRDGLREQGHRVLVVAPVFENMPANEEDVVRVAAMQRFRGSDFSLPFPLVPQLNRLLKRFAPDIVHSHHPFLLGDAALRIGAARSIPVVFTYHTRYELYRHYVLNGSARFARLVVRLSSGYCNLCDGIIAPSASIRTLLHEQQVQTPMEVIPTGIPVERLAAGNGRGARARLGIAEDAFVVGHLGRLAPEKNIAFVTESIVGFMVDNARAVCLIGGEGPMKAGLIETFDQAGLSDRLYLLGNLDNAALADTYCAMDVFAFASQSETQGLVLAEAMAAGVPVVAVDAPGVREVVRDGVNGRLLEQASGEAFVNALQEIAALDEPRRAALRQAAMTTAADYSVDRMVERTLGFYQQLLAHRPGNKSIDSSRWAAVRRNLGEEWRLVRNLANAVGDAVTMVKPEK